MDIDSAFTTRFATFLSRIGEPDLRVLLGSLEAESHAVGDVIIQDGEEQDCLIFLDEGVLSIAVKTPGGLVDVDQVQEGGVVGEVSILDPGPATATVTVVAPAKLRRLRANALDALWKEHPAVASALVQGLSRVLAERIRAIDEALNAAAEDPESLPRGAPGLRQLFRKLFGMEDA